MANRERTDQDRERERERRSSTRGIDWDLEGSAPPREKRSATDQGYDEAAHRGAAYGLFEGHGGAFGTSGGGTYAGGFQVDNRIGSPRGTLEPHEIEEGEGMAPSTERGPWAGRGPSGYRRSDERIADEVHDRLEAHGWVDATDIEIDVQNGEVTLGGTVATREMRWAAEDAVDDIPGVTHVRNDLRVRNR
ncbi:MAG: BON domain-containing protein [Thermoanaerobaculia bacterium]